MKEIIVEGLNPGDILAQNVSVNRNVLVKAGAVVTRTLISKLREFGVVSVFIESQEEEEIDNSSIESDIRLLELKIGDYVCRQGDKSDSIYILKDGFLEVLVKDELEKSENEDNNDGERKIAELTGYNINFGEIGAILGIDRTASVRAVIPSQVLVIPVERNSFVFSMKRHPELGINIAETMAKRLKDIDDRIRMLSVFSQKLDRVIEYNSKAFYSLVQRISAIFSENPNESWIGVMLDFLRSHDYYSSSLKIFRKKETNAKESEDISKEENVYFISKDIREFEANETVCREGEPGDQIFILVAGRIGVYVGNERVATISQRGSVFGEVAVLAGFRDGKYDKRTATLKAVTYSQVVIIPGVRLVSRISEDPGLIAQINISLAQKLPGADQSYIDLRDRIVRNLDLLSQEGLFEYMYNTFNEHILLVDFILKDEFRLIQLLKNKVSLDVRKFREEFSNL